MYSNDQVIDNLIEIDVKDDDQFLILRESLTRIGIANKSTKSLYQTCHILHKRGKYYLVHFKQMFMLDGRKSTMDSDDYGRLKKILEMIVSWNLTTPIKVPSFYNNVEPYMCFVLSNKQKHEWNLVPKYKVGAIK